MLRCIHFLYDVMPGTEYVEKPVFRKEPVYATKYYYELDKWTVVDTANSSGNDQNPSWPEPKLKDGQRTGAEEEHYFVTATYEKKKGKPETGRYEMDYSQWKELKKGENDLENGKINITVPRSILRWHGMKNMLIEDNDDR